MHLSTLRVEVQIGAGFRSKRKTVQLILAKIQRHFNVSVAELAGEGHPSQSTLGIAALARNRRDVRAVLEQVADALMAHPRAEILQVDWDDH